jgi:hypothetical protein
VADRIPPNDELPLSFVACLSNSEALYANPLASPCLASATVHELIAVSDCPSAADGLNIGLKRAKHDWVVWARQDVLLPAGWDRFLALQLREAESAFCGFGPIAVAGVYGAGPATLAIGGQAPRCATEPVPCCPPLAAQRIGWVVDRGRVLRDGPELPARVATLDELLLVVRRDTPLRFDPALGFHLYGADICLQAAERGLAVVALGAPCYHNSRSVGLPEAFYRSAEVFARKWSHRLPVATPCAIIDRGGRVNVLGNAAEGARSIAYAS